MRRALSSESRIQITEVPIGDLRPAPYNPRSWSDSAKEKLKDSIRKFGAVDPLIVNAAPKRKGIVIGGHFRLECMKELEFTNVPVVFVNIPDIKREKELNIRLNRNQGAWDFEKLKEFDIGVLLDVGFDDGELSHIWDDALIVDDDTFKIEDELKKIKKPKSHLGDLYQLGSHRLIVGDSTDPKVVQRLMGPMKVSLIDTDPPYSIGLDYNGGIGGKRNYGGTTNDHMSEEEYTSFLRKLISNALSVANKDAHIIFWCDQNWIWLTQTLYRELGIKHQRVCWWLKDNFMVTPNVAFNKAGEAAVYGIIGRPYLAPNITNLHEIMDKEVGTGKRMLEDVADLFSIWLCKRTASAEMNHPTQKLPSLYEKALRRCTKPGDNILDLTGGSGSLLIAADCLKRRAFVVEKEPIFADLIIRRFEALTGIKAFLIKS